MSKPTVLQFDSALALARLAVTLRPDDSRWLGVRSALAVMNMAERVRFANELQECKAARRGERPGEIARLVAARV